MILPLNKNVDNKNLIRVMKLGGEHGQMKSFFFLLSFLQSWGLKEGLWASSSAGDHSGLLDNETHRKVHE